MAFPDFPYDAAVGVLVSGDAASAFRGLIESGAVRQLQDRSDRVGGFASMMTRAADYVDALRLRMKMRAALDELPLPLRRGGGPDLPGTAEPIGYDFDQAPDAPAHACPRTPRVRPGSCPRATWRAFPRSAFPPASGRTACPPSIQFLGRAFSEGVLLAIGDRFQQATDWHLQAPAHRPRLTAMPDPLLATARRPAAQRRRGGAARSPTRRRSRPRWPC